MSTEQKYELCPLCRGVRIETIIEDGFGYQRCMDCGAIGPIFSRRSDDDEVGWNNRVGPAPVQRDVLTPAMLADALACFWNAAIGEAIQLQEGMVFASIMATGMSAVQRRLEEQAKAIEHDTKSEGSLRARMDAFRLGEQEAKKKNTELEAKVAEMTAEIDQLQTLLAAYEYPAGFQPTEVKHDEQD